MRVTLIFENQIKPLQLQQCASGPSSRKKYAQADSFSNNPKKKPIRNEQVELTKAIDVSSETAKRLERSAHYFFTLPSKPWRPNTKTMSSYALNHD